MSAVPPPAFVTPEEYLAAEELASAKHEYVNGEVYAMAGGSIDYATIAVNLGRILGTGIGGSGCRVFGSDLRIKVESTAIYTYPDLSVVCGQVELDHGQRDCILNPILIVEVLSPSTEACDRGDKFAHYQRLASLKQYVLVAQDKPRVEVYTRDGEEWRMRTYEGLAVTARFDSIGCAAPLAEIYADVEFPSGGRGVRL